MVVVVADGVVDAMVAEREAESQSADSLFVGLDFLKATPHTEGERRFVHFEASNDALDQEGERILKSALFADRAFYLEKGNIDLEHLTILGYRMVDPATGRLLIKNPRDYEIGLPVEVSDTAHVIFAKGEIYRGHEQADKIWHSITTQKPPPQPGVGT